MSWLLGAVLLLAVALELLAPYAVHAVVSSRSPITKRIQDEFFALVEAQKPDRRNWLTPVRVPPPAVR